MKKRILIVFIFFSFKVAVYSQNETETDSLLMCLKQTQNVKEKAKTLEQLSFVYSGRFNFDKAIKYSSQLVELSAKEGFLKHHLNALFVLGNSYFLQGEYKSAMKEFNLSLIISLKNLFPKGIAKACQNISKTYGKQGEYIKATSFAIQSIKIYNEVGDVDNLLFIKANLTELYIAQKDYKKACDIQNEILDYYTSTNDTARIAGALGFLGAIKFYKKNYNEALQFYTKSLEFSKKTNNKLSVAVTQGNIAEVLEIKGEYKKALEYYFNALEVEKELNFQSGIIFLYYGIGNTYKEMNNPRKALSFYNKSLQLIKITRETAMKPKVLNSVAQTYAKKKDFKNAYDYNIQYHILNDSLFGIEKMKEIEKMQAKYRFENNEQEIEKQKEINKYNKLQLENKKIINLLLVVGIFSTMLILIFILIQRNKAKKTNIHLALKNREILKKSEKLDILNKHMIKLHKFKQAMTGMIVHDLKNPLNIIINSDNIVYTQHSGRHMLLMVQNILDIQTFEEAQLGVKTNNESIYLLSQEATAQVSLLIETKKLSVFNNISPKYGVLADSEKIIRVFVNILTNAIKYTDQKGSITLNCEPFKDKKSAESKNSKAQYYKISIKDTGDGIPSDKLDIIFDMFEQVEPKKSGKIHSTGIGLTFCKLAVEAHGGSIRAKSVLGKGSEFCFTLQKGADISNDLPAEQYTQVELNLTSSDKQYLKPFINELKKLEVYDISKAEKILSKVDFARSKEITEWKNKMESTLYITDEDLFADLLNL